MKVGVTVWEDTVSTVCDFSSRLLIFDVTGDKVKNRSLMPLETGVLPDMVHQLEELGVQVLLCGAISRPLERMVRASGVHVIPCLRGSIEEVIRAYLDETLSDTRFVLPGCGREGSGPREHRRRRC